MSSDILNIILQSIKSCNKHAPIISIRDIQHPRLEAPFPESPHIVGVVVTPAKSDGSGSVGVTCDGVHILPPEEIGRGVAVGILLHDENGEDTVLSLRFHKGTVFIYNQRVPVQDDEDGHPVFFHDIWRD